MPAVSKAQQRLMGAAEHGADFPMADKLRQTMSHDQLHDFAVGSMANKPEHISPSSAAPPAHNVKAYMSQGLNEFEATKKAVSRHKNLGKFLHPRKDGRPHGSSR